MDLLEYGRRFTVDAYSQSVSASVERGEVERYLLDLHGQLEGELSPHGTALVEDGDGYSAAVLGAEAHAVLHVFPTLATMSLQVFSRRDVLLSDLTRNLARHFRVGRFESHLSSATKALPRDPDRLRKTISGDRRYARVRLDDRLLAP